MTMFRWFRLANPAIITLSISLLVGITTDILMYNINRIPGPALLFTFLITLPLLTLLKTFGTCYAAFLLVEFET